MSQLLPYLLILVCPLAMGGMMWLMMRGSGQGHQPDPRVAELESQLNELRSEVHTGRPREPAQESADAPAADRV